jgi:hypothetical protein
MGCSLFAYLDQVLATEDLEGLRRVSARSEKVEMDGTTYGCAATYDLWHQRFGRPYPDSVEGYRYVISFIDVYLRLRVECANYMISSTN